MMGMDIPRLMVAAPHGRSGKTTVTMGIIAALARRGLVVQPFKKGPDYIDPSWLTGSGGRPCRNLDLFMMGDAAVGTAFCRGAAGADVAVIEGAMGLYDGRDLEGTGSSASLARLLGTPIVLVVDATRMTRSVAAMVSGYQHFEAGVNVAGVILNNVARSRHEEMLVGAIERYCGIPVVGCIPRRAALAIPDRHLGLVPRAENDGEARVIDEVRRVAEENISLDLVLAIARSAPPLATNEWEPVTKAGPPTRIGVLMDRVFTFYYPENLEALEAAGARLEIVDSLADQRLPDVSGLYIGGGFPEVFMEALEANEPLRRDIRQRVKDGLPVYAECAGLIYLSRAVHWGERRAEMVGILPCEVEMTGWPQGHGYAVGEVMADGLFLERGREIRGHEFHNTRVLSLDESRARFAYKLSRGAGIDANHHDGLMVENVLAAYTHLHALATPGWAEWLVGAARHGTMGRAETISSATV
jgi:cobyrinic acid a,c-diamide synthase